MRKPEYLLADITVRPVIPVSQELYRDWGRTLPVSMVRCIFDSDYTECFHVKGPNDENLVAKVVIIDDKHIFNEAKI